MCPNFDILSNMNVCSVTLARTVRYGAMGMLETRSSSSLPRSRSRQGAGSSSRQGAGSSSRTTSSPLKGTLKTSTMTCTSRSRMLSTLGRGASPSTSGRNQMGAASSSFPGQMGCLKKGQTARPSRANQLALAAPGTLLFVAIQSGLTDKEPSTNQTKRAKDVEPTGKESMEADEICPLVEL